jgi:hypothetical protein
MCKITDMYAVVHKNISIAGYICEDNEDNLESVKRSYHERET